MGIKITEKLNQKSCKPCNILIITDDFLPTPSANGVCAYNIAKILLDKGCAVKVLCNRQHKEKSMEWIDGLQVFRVWDSFFTRKMTNSKAKDLIIRIALASHLFIYPIKSINFLLRMIHKAINILKNYNIDTVISFNNPLEACLTGSVLKNYFGSIHFCVYDLDSFSNVLDGKFIKKKFKYKMMWHWERMVFEYADNIVIMENHKSHYDQDRYVLFQGKICVSNFPTLILKEDNHLVPKSNLYKPTCVYLGTLVKAYRNPENICKIFLNIEDLSLVFYGKSDTEEILKEYHHISQGRITHGGFVKFSHGQQKLREADFLISIGNINSDMIPSKTFEYISFGKPIVHFYTYSEDPVLHHLRKYPLSLLLDINDPIDKAVTIVKHFINNTFGKRISSETIKEIYYMNTPEYSVDLIENFYKNRVRLSGKV